MTRRITRINELIGARENKENLPKSKAVKYANGNPTTISKTPAEIPVTRIHSFGFMNIPTAVTPQPSMANQCKRCTKV